MVCPPKLRKTKAPKTCGLVSQFPNSVQHEVNDLANDVVATGIVIGSIFLAYDELRVEELAAGTSANSLMTGFQVYKQCLGHLLASACLPEDVESYLP